MAAPADEEVFAAVQVLVDAGEYLDQIPGLPGERTEGGGAFRVGPDGTRSRLYSRHSIEYREAKAAGVVEALPTPPQAPAAPAAVAMAEGLVGPLPPLLRRLYMEVANGGFGPGYGLLGLRGGHGVAPEGDAVARRVGWMASEPKVLPTLLPICDWGCAITSLVDCRDGTMWGLDPNPIDDVVHALHPQDMDLAEWWWLWLQGRLCQPWTVQDPDSGVWRAATTDETAAALDEW